MKPSLKEILVTQRLPEHANSKSTDDTTGFPTKGEADCEQLLKQPFGRMNTLTQKRKGAEKT